MGKKTKIAKLIFYISIFLALLNLLSCFVPEVGFDALWYHLTLPKLWLLKHQYHFNGGLLYYSVMPRLTEWFYTPLIYYTGAIGPKVFQYLCGLGVSVLIYKISLETNLKKNLSILGATTFYLTYLVSWQSSSAYIDLFRTLLEVCALYSFLKNKRIHGSIFLGLSLGTKWLSLISLAVYALVFGWQVVPLALAIASPWFYIAYHYTGNPLYPLFDQVLSNGLQKPLKGIFNLLTAPYQITFPFDDFLSPVAGLVFSLSAVSLLIDSNKKRLKVTTIGLVGGLVHLLLDPPSSRFFLPFFPAIIISCMYLMEKTPKVLQNILIYIFLFSALFVISIKLVTFQRNIPYLTGKQSQNQYLESLSVRLPDTFVDTDNFVKNNLAGESIIIDKLHNLYYFPYSYDHTSWANKDKSYNYLVTTDQEPDKINGKLINTNSIGIQIFKLNQ